MNFLLIMMSYQSTFLFLLLSRFKIALKEMIADGGSDSHDPNSNKQ